MPISEAARRNHDALFGDRVSTLARTDPELMECFTNFAFDETLADSDLDPPTRLIVQLAALIACQSLAEFRVLAGAALGVGLTPVQLKEIVYQAVPYVGMAKVVDFLHVTNQLLGERGVALPLPGQSTTTPGTRREAGLAAQKKVVGSDQVDAMHAERFRRREALPAVSVSELLRGLSDPVRDRPVAPRAAHLRHARRAWRL